MEQVTKPMEGQNCGSASLKRVSNKINKSSPAAMKTTCDREVDALYIRFKETTVTTKHVDDGIALNYDAAQRLANPDTLGHVVFESGAHSETANRTVAAP